MRSPVYSPVDPDHCRLTPDGPPFPMTPFSHLSAASHGPQRARFEGEPTLTRTLALALGLAAVFALGVSLIIHGLL